MSTRNDRLNRQMLRKDDCTLPDDRRHGNSDRGEALEHMLDELDGVPGEHASRAEKELVDEIQLSCGRYFSAPTIKGISCLR